MVVWIVTPRGSAKDSLEFCRLVDSLEWDSSGIPLVERECTPENCSLIMICIAPWKEGVKILTVE